MAVAAAAASLALTATGVQASPVARAAGRPVTSGSAEAVGATRPATAFSVHPSGTEAQLIPQFEALKAMGAREIRTDFQWTTIQPGGFGTPYDWTQNDVDVQAASAVGLKVDAVLDYGNPLYSAAGAANGDSTAYPPDNLEDFARFAAEVVRHYHSPAVERRLGGDPVADWEVWNEPNVSYRFWLPAADPAAYGTLLCDTYHAVKAADPAATVVSAGLVKAPVGSFPAGEFEGGTQFLDQMLTSIGHRRCADAFAFHPYPYPFVSPEATVPGPGSTSVATYPDQLRAVLRRHGVPASTPLVGSEIGWPTNPADNGVTAEKQAEYTVRTSLLSWEHGIPMVTWYDQYDAADAATNTNQEEHFGFFGSDGSPKAVVGAMQTYQRVLGGRGWKFTADLSGRLGLPAGADGVDQGFALEFAGPDGQHALALWYANEPEPPAACDTGVAVLDCPVTPTMPASATVPVTLHLPGSARIVTMSGATSRLHGPQAEAGQAPVYITWRGPGL